MQQLREMSPLTYFIGDHDLVMDEVKKYVLRVKDMPEEEKPREKMIKFGANNLTSAELIAVLLGTGTKKEEVMSLASRIIKEYGERTLTLEQNPQNLSEELSLPIGKACQIVASFELGRRYFKKNESGPICIRDSKEAYEYLQEMGKLNKEHLRGLYLNSHFMLVHEEIISIGTLTSNVIHPREVFRPAIEHSAAAIIIAHNHPSGNLTPTKSDISVTKQIKEAGSLIGIELIDHLVITKNGFCNIPLE